MHLTDNLESTRKTPESTLGEMETTTHGGNNLILNICMRDRCYVSHISSS